MPTKATATPRRSIKASAQNQEPASDRGRKRRELIKASARTVLQRVGYRAMKVADVAAEADIAVGLFYHYFPDLKTVTCEVLSDFLREMADAPMPQTRNRFDLIYAPTLLMVTAFEENLGLMRCLFQVADEDREFKALWNEASTAWTHRVAKNIARQFPEGQLGEGFSRSLAYALGAMVDGLLNELYIQNNSDARALLRTPQAIAELLSTLWYRAIYLENPPAARLTLTAQMARMSAATRAKKTSAAAP